MNPKVPKMFQFLYKVKELPKMVEEALNIIGTKEVPGAKSNPIILGWAKALGLAAIYINDGIAWCGLTIAWLCHLADKPIVLEPLYALNWRQFGIEVVPGDEACGDVYITERFDKDGKLIGGHVGLIIAENKTHFFIYGGNQSDQTCIVMFPKTRRYWARRPQYSVRPKGAVKIMLNEQGIPASKVA